MEGIELRIGVHLLVWERIAKGVEPLILRGISLPKISYAFGKNPFFFKKNPSKIRINPFVLKKISYAFSNE